MITVFSSITVPGKTMICSTRPAVSAVTHRICSGTRVPGPLTWRIMVPCITVSIHTVAASTVGAAGSRFLNPTVTPIRAKAATDHWMILFLVFGLGSRAMSTITSLSRSFGRSDYDYPAYDSLPYASGRSRWPTAFSRFASPRWNAYRPSR